MRIFALKRDVLSVGIVAVLLAGCGGSQPPIGAPSAMSETSAIARHGAHGKSWMLPGAKSKDLLYASSGRTTVYVLAYPSAKLVGSLDGFEGANGECTDAHGNVFITDSGASEVVEYAHGGTTPIKTLQDGTYEPYSCSVDPGTGNLAVSNLRSSDLSIYKNARGSPVVYTVRVTGWESWYCGYDDKGNLFLDGEVSGPEFGLAELAKGSSTLRSVTVGQAMGFPGAIQWDGQYLAVGWANETAATVDQLSVSYYVATVVGSTQLLGPGKFRIAREAAITWIQGGKIISPYSMRGDRYYNVGLWPYPAGGNFVRAIHVRSAEDDQLIGVTVSVAPH